MKLNVKLIVILFLLPISFYGQIRASKQINPSKLAKQINNKLYFIDFWATWCGPCINVSKYLETLQEQFSNDLYIISLTQESPDVVIKFLKGHETDLAVFIDFDGENFKKYQVQSLPHGILLNAKGEKLWEGHPANLKPYLVEKFLKTNYSKISLNDFVKLDTYTKTSRNSQVELVLNEFEIEPDENYVSQSIQINNNIDFIEIVGDLQDILAYALNVNKNQIHLNAILNDFYKVKFKINSQSQLNLFETVLESLNLQSTIGKSNGEGLELLVDDSMFWDKSQIDWGDNSLRFLISDTDIQADNLPFNKLKYQLSNLLNMPILVKNTAINNEEHDWQIHYKYYDLMVNNLNNYGITVEKKIIEFPYYSITKKTP